MTRDNLACPNCFEGAVYIRCGTCGGSGQRGVLSIINPTITCPDCGGAGEVREPGPCHVCGGEGYVTYTLMRLAEADRWVRANRPEWSGDNRDHNRVTMYSMAEWFRRRGDAPTMARAWGGIVAAEAVVLLFSQPDDGRPPWITFTGLSWGYGGEGPNGLAAVLADAFPDDFPVFDEAMAFVSRQTFGDSWTLKRGMGGLVR